MISISSIYLRYEKRDELAVVWGEKNCHPSAQNCNFYQVAKPRIFSKAKRLFEAAYNDLLIILSSAKISYRSIFLGISYLDGFLR